MVQFHILKLINVFCFTWVSLHVLTFSYIHSILGESVTAPINCKALSFCYMFGVFVKNIKHYGVGLKSVFILSGYEITKFLKSIEKGTVVS